MLPLIKWRPLLVGQAPSQSGDPKLPLTGNFGRRVANLMGMTFHEYLYHFERVNAVEEWHGKNGKGDEFDVSRITPEREEYVLELAHGRPFTIFFGRATGEAFVPLSKKRDYFEPNFFFTRTITAYVAPHPSGINLWWNSPDNITRARKFFQEVADVARKSRPGRSGSQMEV